MRVGLAYNLIRSDLLQGKPLDVIAEYDSQATIDAVRSALVSGGHQVELIEVDLDVVSKIIETKPDIIFNIAEGIRGEGREALLPCLCESLEIPYTGSGPVTLAICLDKARTKQALKYHHLPFPDFQVIGTASEPVHLPYPVILKLLAEGSSIGLDYGSVVYNREQAISRANRLITTYQSQILIEEFIDGIELTVPVLGNDPPEALPIVELSFDAVPNGLPKINLFSPDDSIVDLIEMLGRTDEILAYNHRPICPARLDRDKTAAISDLAIKAYQALGCRDWCRIDFRLDQAGNPYILELNPIAGIDPGYLLPLSASCSGLEYDELINRILELAITRYGL